MEGKAAHHERGRTSADLTLLDHGDAHRDLGAEAGGDRAGVARAHLEPLGLRRRDGRLLLRLQLLLLHDVDRLERRDLDARLLLTRVLIVAREDQTHEAIVHHLVLRLRVDI